MLVGSLETVIVPGFGTILTLGSIFTTLATAITGAGVGAASGALVGSLVDIGFPEEEVNVYLDEVKNGQILVTFTGKEEQIPQVESVFRKNAAKMLTTFPGKENKTSVM